MRFSAQISCIATALLLLSAGSAIAQPVSQQRPVICTQDDLPRHRYPILDTAMALYTADDATFNAFAVRVAADADAVLNGYEIPDAATRRKLLGTRLMTEMLTGRNEAGLATVLAIRALEEKPEAKLTSGIREEAILRARMATGAASGPVFEAKFRELYVAALSALPFSVTGNRLKESKSKFEIQSAAIVAGFVETEVQPAVERDHALSDSGADDLIWARTFKSIYLPLKSASVAALRQVIAAHAVTKPDMWAAREVTITERDAGQPVVAAVWDSGVDITLFPGQIYSAPGGNGHGLSFDIDSRPTTGVLRPIPAEEQAGYAAMVGDFQGMSDNRSAIDSPAAEAFRAKAAAMSASESAKYRERMSFFGDYLHGTHVAGIMARGNAMIRLAVIRDTYDTRTVPAPPTDASVARRVALYRDVSAWLRKAKVRVVNMSWNDTPSSYERDLEKNGIGKDPAERKAMARRFFEAARNGFVELLKENPDTVFVSAAGNSDSDTAFEEGYPSSTIAPNLIVVSAVDLAGDETGFTSSGSNVAVSANGYQVMSVVPGGRPLAESGTSMASPNVANLAAKLIALKPDLTATQVIALIKAGATLSDDGRRRNINPKASVELLRAGNY